MPPSNRPSSWRGTRRKSAAGDETKDESRLILLGCVAFVVVLTVAVGVATVTACSQSRGLAYLVPGQGPTAKVFLGIRL